MRKSVLSVFAALLLVAGIVTACSTAPASPTTAPTEATAAPVAATEAPATAAPAEAVSALSGEINVAGSTTVQPLAEKFAEAFMALHPDVRVSVQGGGSSTGVKSAGEGTVDIGAASREIQESELADFPNLHIFVIARDGIAIIANPDVPVEGLTTEQVRYIFAGVITNWSEVGGPDMEIGLVNRDEASGTREAFHKIVMDDARFDRGAVVLPGTGQVRAVVAQVEGAIGYISLGFVNDEVRAIAIDGVEPSEETVVSGDYPIQRTLHFFTKGEVSDATRDYIDYVLSPEVQDVIVREAGFIPITAKEVPGD